MIFELITSDEVFKDPPAPKVLGQTQFENFLPYRHDYIVIGARPSIGKTSFALSYIISFLKENIGSTCLFVSCEMNKQQILLFLHRQGAWGVLEKSNLYICTPREMCVPALFTELEEFHSEHTPAIICIDHLHLLEYTKNFSNRFEEVRKISQAIKTLRDSCESRLLVLAQLNREGEKRGFPPYITDLKDSGSIEADADAVVLLDRPEVRAQAALDRADSTTTDAALGKHHSVVLEQSGKMNIYISKNRYGKTGVIRATFLPERLLVTNF